MTEAALEILRLAMPIAAGVVTRTDGRPVEKGIREREELAPAFEVGLRDAYEQVGRQVPRIDSDRDLTGLAGWNRLKSQIDVVVEGGDGRIELVGELKAWDIGHQIFDLLKVCCLVDGLGSAGFLGCVAKRGSDFDVQAGGELFSATDGEARVHDVRDLLGRHPRAMARHLGHGGPEPTLVPAEIRTTATGTPLGVGAYPGHELRACVVEPLGTERVALASMINPQASDPRFG